MTPAILQLAPPDWEPAKPARRLLSFGQVRRRLGISRWTLRDWVESGRFPTHTHELPELKSQSQRRRWDVAVVDEWTEKRRTRGGA